MGTYIQESDSIWWVPENLVSSLAILLYRKEGMRNGNKGRLFIID